MAFQNYNDYVQSLATFIVIAPITDANFQIALPRIIDDAEQRIYRELDILGTVLVNAAGALTPNSRNFTFPTFYVVSEQINVFNTVGVTATGRQPLVPVTREYIDWVYGNETAPSTPSIPEYFGMVTDQTIVVGPAPDAAYTIEVVGEIRPVPLSQANPNTYLTNYYPDLFFAASMVAGYAYIKDFGPMTDDPQGGATWETHYKNLWQSANVEEQRKRYASQSWSPKQPAAIATPPRA